MTDLEGRLDDALRLKREVESQAEVIRILTGRVEEERENAEQMSEVLGAVKATLAYRVYRVTYRTKVAVYRQVQPILDRRRRNRGTATESRD